MRRIASTLKCMIIVINRIYKKMIKNVI